MAYPPLHIQASSKRANKLTAPCQGRRRCSGSQFGAGDAGPVGGEKKRRRRCWPRGRRIRSRGGGEGTQGASGGARKGRRGPSGGAAPEQRPAALLTLGGRWTAQLCSVAVGAALVADPESGSNAGATPRAAKTGQPPKSAALPPDPGAPARLRSSPATFGASRGRIRRGARPDEGRGTRGGEGGRRG